MTVSRGGKFVSITALDGKHLQIWYQGAHHLIPNADYVDALNVFPVPDGDTGTNMNLSMTSGAKEVKNHVQEHIGKTALPFLKDCLWGHVEIQVLFFLNYFEVLENQWKKCNH